MSIVDEAHFDLVTWAERPHGGNPHAPWSKRLSGCQAGENDNTNLDSEVEQCFACAVNAAAHAIRQPLVLAEVDGKVDELWRFVPLIAGHWAAKGHPAAVHMQRLADELELRYGGQT